MANIESIKNTQFPSVNSNDQPNAATLAALKEVEDMKKNPSKYKSYPDVDSMMEDLLK
ncbi:MAG: hypothetical protein K5858_09480 [Lachnospiraceae bacterium]|nr:hypothetical protein [Lachnospiraceae bacterium]